MSRRTALMVGVPLAVCGGLVLLAALSPTSDGRKPPQGLIVDAPGSAPPGMVWIKGGRFMMGSAGKLEDETPEHEVELDGFWMDETEVTNAQFLKFVEATGYETIAEKTPRREDFVDQ